MKRRFLMLTVLTAVAVLLALGRAPEMPQASERLAAASQGLDEIRIDASLDADKRTLAVHQVMTLRNRTGEDQVAVTLRTWPNAFQSLDTSPCAADDDWYDRFYPDGFSMGALVMARAQANGETVLHRYTDEAKTVLKIPVPGGWAAGETIDIALEYTVQIPLAAYRFGYWDGVFALGNAFAIPAVGEEAEYFAVGDPFVSECANYTVELQLPNGYLCAGSGTAQKTKDGYRFTALAVRDFALVISNRFHKAQAREGDVLVTAYGLSAAEAKEMLDAGRKAIRLYGELWGEYPYPSYDLAAMHMPLGGMEYPALAMIASGQEGRELVYTIAHETAHQWWYAMVGSDGVHQPWQDEALSEYAVLEYAEKYYGRGERQDLEQSRMQSAMRVTVSQGLTPGAPLDRFSTMSEYSLVVYHRGAAYLCALNEMIDLNQFLRDYVDTYAFSLASREDFERQLSLSTGEDLAPLTRDYLDTQILN